MRKVISIASDQHFADYAEDNPNIARELVELRKSPVPNYHFDPHWIWPTACALFVVIVVARLLW